MPDVVSVKTLGGYRVRLEFEDGVTGELDLESMISFKGVFAPLRDEREFSKARVDVGTITWPTGADLCPDVLYSKVTGKPIVGVATERDGSPDLTRSETSGDSKVP